MTTPDPTRGDPVTDPHDRPYTFGWHGEVVRRLGDLPPVKDPAPNPLLAAYIERVRAVAERAWDEGYVRGANNGTNDDWDDDANPYRKDADQ